MKNKNALKLVEKIRKELFLEKFELNSVIEDLKKIRENVLEDNNPVLNKAIRLAYEHLENNNAFLIGIPFDETTEETENTFNFSENNDLESLDYFLSLLLNMEKKNNLLDVREYNKAFLAF